MKFNTLIYISALALAALLFVQYYFISETFSNKQEQFNSKYGGLSKLGLYEYENQYFDPAEDSIFQILDEYAFVLLYNADSKFFNHVNDSSIQAVNDLFSDILNLATGKDIFLQEYIRKAGEPSEFSSFQQIRKLDFLTFNKGFSFLNDSSKTLPPDNKEALLIKTYTIERNNYRISYDYYIDFPFRKKQIARESSLIIALSLTSLLIVFIVFTLTLRNLFFQKRLSEMKTDFINNMTHELKTPLSTISVASSSLALHKGQLSETRIKEISATIKKQNRHLTKLIERILDISIWEKDQVRIHKNSVNIYQFMKDLSDNFMHLNPNAKYDFHCRDIDRDKQFNIDEIHMTTVINNLLSNAVKYSDQPAKISMSCICGSILRIQISDEGNGISREEQRHIFEKFYRGADCKKDAIRGLGLGLYYVKQIVEAHGGSIEVDSKKGIGSKFKIEIPE